MKALNYLSGTLILSLLVFCAQAQDTKKDKDATKIAATKNLVDSQNYVFIAQTALPLSGNTRQLTSDYDLKVTKSTVVSYLPYFGRAYTAPIDPTKGGIQFTSKDFEYSATPRDKGGWDVVIKPRDFQDVQQMSLNISSTGYATLSVTSTNRQVISFNGYIRAPRQKRK
jgi:hypothetical protein